MCTGCLPVHKVILPVQPIPPPKEVEQEVPEHVYIVYIREVYVQSVRVKAKSKEDAIALAVEGVGEDTPDTLEYSHTLPEETWTVERCPLDQDS